MPGTFRVLPLLCLTGLLGCAVLVSRPNQDMSDTAAALRAAREVQADTLFPELMTQATGAFFQAKQEYRLKNFSEALRHARKARRLAEEAEYLSLKKGGNRTTETLTDPFAEGLDQRPVSTRAPSSVVPKSLPYEYPKPTGMLATDYEAQKKKEEEHQRELEKIQAQGLSGSKTPPVGGNQGIGAGAVSP